jgi:antitoxin component HigA of HigAB toxin-antitoxin module
MEKAALKRLTEKDLIMATKTIRRRADAPQDNYLQLVLGHPLKAIRNDAELRAAHKAIDPLSVIDENKLTPGQADYLFALTDLIWAYEQQHHPLDLRQGDHADGIDLLRMLMEEKGMNASDLGRLLGKRQLGSAILRRERQLSKSHITRLAAYFGVSADLLLRTKPRAN